MRLQLYKHNFYFYGDRKVIWEIKAENMYEAELLDFIRRILKSSFIEKRTQKSESFEDDLIYPSDYLRKIFEEKDNLSEIYLSYVSERGGIFSFKKIINSLEIIRNLLKSLTKNSGLILTTQNLKKF